MVTQLPLTDLSPSDAAAVFTVCEQAIAARQRHGVGFWALNFHKLEKRSDVEWLLTKFWWQAGWSDEWSIVLRRCTSAHCLLLFWSSYASEA